MGLHTRSASNTLSPTRSVLKLWQARLGQSWCDYVHVGTSRNIAWKHWQTKFECLPSQAEGWCVGRYCAGCGVVASRSLGWYSQRCCRVAQYVFRGPYLLCCMCNVSHRCSWECAPQTLPDMSFIECNGHFVRSNYFVWVQYWSDSKCLCAKWRRPVPQPSRLFSTDHNR